MLLSSLAVLLAMRATSRSYLIWAWPEMTTCHSCGYAIYSRCLHLVNILGSNFLRCFPWHLQDETSQLMILTHLFANEGKHCKKPSWALPAAGPASYNGERERMWPSRVQVHVSFSK